VKLLFDENLAPSLVSKFGALFPGSSHVRTVGLKSATDAEIWTYAKAHGFVIVSKDWDFHQLSFLYGAPPKVVWIRRGNCTVREIESILQSNVAALQELEDDAEATLLVLS
jgi:predicted nuclease of predicted toxin-antitoxin system